MDKGAVVGYAVPKYVGAASESEYEGDRRPMIDDAAQRSRALFSSGYYCAESVLMAVAEVHNVESDVIPRIATGFCSGVARTSGQCGAISGAIMGLGLAIGRDSPEKSVEETYALVRELIERFEGKFGSRNCQQLTGCDLSTSEGQEWFRKNNVIDRCYQYAEEATRIVLQLLKHQSGR
jgi:C_GCAxxG_C_C family probable redox protein